jgi:hypothetical protein
LTKPQQNSRAVVVALVVFAVGLVCLALLVAGGLAFLAYRKFPRVEDKREELAVIKATTLSQPCEAYKINNDRYPDTLEDLAKPQPKGGGPLVGADDLLDPWGQPFAYDPAGLRNNGTTPDIWVNRPNGPIGNWPGGHKTN